MSTGEKCLYCRKMAVKVNRLESICAQAYQLAGVCGAPLRVMNRLSAAANGDPGKRSFLPIHEEDLGLGREKIALEAKVKELEARCERLEEAGELLRRYGYAAYRRWKSGNFEAQQRTIEIMDNLYSALEKWSEAQAALEAKGRE